jgi:putative SOS response-associated peptidase YedK
MINARADGLATKPTFRAAFRKRRCLIPADGFYEWQKVEGGAKQPFYIHRPDNKPFAFAGLWERWDRGPVIDSCTIVTTDANRTMSQMHDRMPVILAPNDYDLWLDPGVDDPTALQPLLTSCGEDELLAEPVSTHVNKVANNDFRCIKPLTQSDEGPTLF